MAYCTVQQVRDFTGHKPEDYGIKDHGAFETRIALWIDEAQGIIDADRDRTFDPEGDDELLAGLLRTVTLSIVSNLMEISLGHRVSPIKKAEDPEDKPPPGGPITSAVRKLLDLLPRTSTPKFGMAIVNRLLDEA